MKITPRALLAAALCALCAAAALAAPQPAAPAGTWAAGINYPGVNLRYFLTDRSALEAKAQSQSSVLVAGLRWYGYRGGQGPTRLFWGLEGDAVSFKGSESKGSGFAAEVFAGLEHFVSRRVSLQLDMGPAVLNVTDKDTKKSEGGLDFVVNLGVNCHFGGAK